MRNRALPKLAATLLASLAIACSGQVMGQQLDITYSIVRKNGKFINAPASLSVGAGQSVLARISLIRTNYTAESR